MSPLLISGCARTSTTGEMPAGNRTYVVSRQAGAFPSGREPLLAEAPELAGRDGILEQARVLDRPVYGAIQVSLGALGHPARWIPLHRYK